MYNNKVSVIIPMYNAEKYISRCIKSVLCSTYKNIEIIIINDGSIDLSLQVCKTFKDNRIKIYNIKNSGVSYARNYGVQKSIGKYILFIDSDDTITNQIIEDAVNKIENFNYDIIIWNNLLVKNNNIFYDKQFDYKINFVNNLDIYQYIIYKGINNISINALFRASWGKLYKSDIIKKNNIYFPINQYMGEDAVFLLKYFLHIKYFYFINNYGYKYYIYPFSAARKYYSDLAIQSSIEIQNIYNLLKEYKILNQCYYSFLLLIIKHISDIIENIKKINYNIKTINAELTIYFNNINRYLFYKLYYNNFKYFSLKNKIFIFFIFFKNRKYFFIFLKIYFMAKRIQQKLFYIMNRIIRIGTHFKAFLCRKSSDE